MLFLYSFYYFKIHLFYKEYLRTHSISSIIIGAIVAEIRRMESTLWLTQSLILHKEIYMEISNTILLMTRNRKFDSMHSKTWKIDQISHESNASDRVPSFISALLCVVFFP
jgi:hypothetical protein